jgi:hypothetical protein
MNCLETFVAEDPHPLWGKVHVYEELHTGT